MQPEDIYKVLGTKEGVDRAFAKLDQLKPNIQWWEAGAQPPQWLAAGDVVMSAAYNGRIAAAQKEGVKLGIVWPGSLYDPEYWAVVKGTPNKALAEKFIAFASQPQTQKTFSEKIPYGPVHKGTLDLLPADGAGGAAHRAGQPRRRPRGGRGLLGRPRRRAGTALQRLGRSLISLS